jgi:hypothetical protein
MGDKREKMAMGDGPWAIKDKKWVGGLGESSSL